MYFISGSEDEGGKNSQIKVLQENGEIQPNSQPQPQPQINSKEPQEPPAVDQPRDDIFSTDNLVVSAVASRQSETLNLNLNESSINSQHSTMNNSQKNSQLEEECQNPSMVNYSSFLKVLSERSPFTKNGGC